MIFLCRSRSHSRERRRRSRSRSRDRHHGSPYRSRGGYQRRESGSHRKRSPSPDHSPSRPVTLGPPAKRPSPNAEPPSVERDRRTVMCMQLSAKASPHDLEEFFQKVGQVCDVKMISDRNSRRSKGIAYVEFYDESSVLPVSFHTCTPIVVILCDVCMCVCAGTLTHWPEAVWSSHHSAAYHG